MKPRSRFRVQAAFGFAAVVVLAAAGVALSLGVERASADAREQVLARYSQEVIAAGRLQLGAERLVATARGYILSGDAVLLDAIHSASGELDRAFRRLEADVESRGEEARLAAVASAMHRYRRTLEHLLADGPGSPGRDARSDYFEKELLPRRRELDQRLDELVTSSERMLAAGRETARAASRRAERQVAAIGLVAALMAAAFVWLVARRLDRLYAAQEEATEAARHAVAARDELLGVVSHDLRSPLNVIALRAALLRDVSADAAVRKSAESMLSVAGRMELLIRGLLDGARMESGQLKVVTADCAVADMVAGALEVFGPLAAEKGVELAHQIDQEDMRVSADCDRIVQVLSNLLSNAVKFTAPGGRIDVTVRRDGTRARFEVLDTGLGIPSEHLSRLFDRYWKTGTSGGRATGLGLYIAKAIVTAHGGQITASSAPGAGSTFSFDLPLAPPSNREPTTLGPPRVQSGAV